MAKYTKDGVAEIPDPTPIEIPLGYTRPPTIDEQIMRAVRTTMSMDAARAGQETFEESDDFEIDDDEPLTHAEMMGMEDEVPFGQLPEPLDPPDPPKDNPPPPAKPPVAGSQPPPPGSTAQPTI